MKASTIVLALIGIFFLCAATVGITSYTEWITSTTTKNVLQVVAIPIGIFALVAAKTFTKKLD